VIFHLLLGLAGFLLAWLIFEWRCSDESAYGENPSVGRLKRRFAFLRPKRTWKAALVWKDFHFHFGGKTMLLLRFGLYPVFLALSIWSATSRSWLHDLEEAAWRVGQIAFYLEVTLLTLRSWAPERWGRNLSSLVVTPRALRQMHFQKLAAAVLALTPSLAVLTLAFVLNGGECFQNLLREQGISGLRHASNGGAATLSTLMIRLATYAATAVNLLCFLSFCLNFSLRLKWTALPAALGGWFLTTLLVKMVFLISLVSMGFARSSHWQIIELLHLPLLFLIAGLLLFDTNRQIRRHAADN
jgi:hypothetical protein